MNIDIERLKWDGEGYPPVGTECEAVWLEAPDGGSREYEPVLIKGYHETYCTQVWFATRAGEDIVHLVGNCSFRPIRTQEQIEREVTIAGARKVCPYPGSEMLRLTLDALYDAGLLRKEEW